MVTFHLVTVAFVYFRASSLKQAAFIFLHLLSRPTWTPEVSVFLSSNGRAILIGLIGYALAEAFDWARRREAENPFLENLPRWASWSVYSCTVIAICFVVMLLLVAGEGHSPFLYAIF